MTRNQRLRYLYARRREFNRRERIGPPLSDDEFFARLDVSAMIDRLELAQEAPARRRHAELMLRLAAMVEDLYTTAAMSTQRRFLSVLRLRAGL